MLHSSLMHSIAASDLDNSPGPLDGPNTQPSTDPKLIVHLYHMIAAMDGVYEFLAEYHEDWRAGLRTWLLRYTFYVYFFLCYSNFSVLS